MFTLHIVRKRRGSAMIIGLFGLMLLFAFGISFLSIAMHSVTSSGRDYLSSRALEVAEAGIERGISFLRADGTWRTTHPSSLPDNHQGDTWYVEDMGSGEQFTICARTAVGGNSDRVMITSVGTVTQGDHTVTRTLRVFVERTEENVSPWNNVIFGGVGQSGRSINGNVVMRGSVHLLGDGEPFTDTDGDNHWDDNEPYTDSNHDGEYTLGEPFADMDHDGHRDSREPYVDVNGNGYRDPALTVTDMASEISGTANVGNSYEGISALLSGKLPAPPTTTWNGENVQSLSAKLRVKHGMVNISGSATVGDPNITGDTYKEAMDGCYVSDGYGGNKGSTAVYSDNGSNKDYDLGDGLVKFPALIDPVSGYGTYMDYLHANALVLTNPLTLGTTDFVQSNAYGSINYDGDTGKLTISGIVYINGDLTVNGKGGNLTYAGSGTIVADNDIDIHCNVLPETNFPRTDALGLVAAHNMWVACGSGDAQLTLALAGYAQYKVKIGKQCKIGGTFVASYYEMMNVPHLYQVPELQDHLPPGLPGSEPIWIVDVDILSWQDVTGTGN